MYILSSFSGLLKFPIYSINVVRKPIFLYKTCHMHISYLDRTSYKTIVYKTLSCIYVYKKKNIYEGKQVET